MALCCDQSLNLQVGTVLQFLQNSNFPLTQRQLSVELRQNGILFDLAGFLAGAQQAMQTLQAFQSSQVRSSTAPLQRSDLTVEK